MNKQKIINLKNSKKKYLKYVKNDRGITLTTLVIAIITILILSSITLSMVFGSTGIVAKAVEAKESEKTAKRIEELQMLKMEYQLNGASRTVEPIGKADFVQPWLFNEFTTGEIDEYVKILKRAGYDSIILQYIMEIEGGKGSSDIKAKTLWYNSNVITNTSELELYKPNVLGDLINAIKENNMNIYIGLANSNDWWENDFEDSNWRNKNSEFLNNIIVEIEQKYGNENCFKGWYWNFEMYTNNIRDNDNNFKFGDNWAEMLNSNIKKINDLEGENSRRPIMISPYISTQYEMTSNEVEEQWEYIINKVNFKKGDIFNMQDGLGVLDLDINKIQEFIAVTKEAVKKDKSKELEFWLNVENYSSNNKQITTNEFKRFILQLQIASIYAEHIATFSYSHYYNPKYLDGIEYDKQYRQYYTGVTGSENHIIPAPTNGKVYEDKNGNEVPVPSGFSVSQTENCVNEGLVIKDQFGNEFVWIPVNGGIGRKGYTYSDSEYKTVYYARYLQNGININDVQTANLSNGVSNEKNQITKYGGFYVGRYESSFNYNNGNPTVQIKNNETSTAATDFAWQYANNNIYTGYLWNNINSADAKLVSEQMSIKYRYHFTVKTGLITGTQWDTMLKWIHSNDSTFSKISNGTTWGNYNDSVEPATNDNYEKGVLKPSGSNENWKFNNIYDISGNLAEWTNEVDSNNKFVIRSNGYNDNGIYGSASYGIASDSYQYPHVGFRVVLYIN